MCRQTKYPHSNGAFHLAIVSHWHESAYKVFVLNIEAGERFIWCAVVWRVVRTLQLIVWPLSGMSFPLRLDPFIESYGLAQHVIQAE